MVWSLQGSGKLIKGINAVQAENPVTQDLFFTSLGRAGKIDFKFRGIFMDRMQVTFEFFHRSAGHKQGE